MISHHIERISSGVSRRFSQLASSGKTKCWKGPLEKALMNIHYIIVSHSHQKPLLVGGFNHLEKY
jgi:hypothetical protein